jgi:hypothetical protein
MTAAYVESDRDASVSLWQQVFGSDFKNPPAPVQLAEASLTIPATEKFIDRDFPFHLAPAPYKFRIVGRVNRLRGFRHYDLPTQGNRVRKGRTLTFRVAACDVPEPFDLYWKISNTGEEAAAARDLRGEIRKDAGQRQHVEHTKYRGSHYVEAYIVKNGLVVARYRQQVFVT